LVGQSDSFGIGALAGGVIGSLGGGCLGARHRKGRRDPLTSEVGTTVCMTYALLPALLILLGGLDVVRGKFSGLLVLGAACAAPMGGLLVGGVLDRAYEGALRWRQESTEGTKGNGE